jgi:hypothetical protein
MVKKVVVCVMTVVIAALAWQGLTSLPAGTDEETGSLITWGKDSVWGLFPDVLDGATHAGYYEPGDQSWHMVDDASDNALQRTGLTFQWQEDGVLFAIGSEGGNSYLHGYSLYDDTWYSDVLPFSLGAGAGIAYQPNDDYDGETYPVPGWLYCLAGGGAGFWRFSIPTSLPGVTSNSVYPADGATIADNTPLFQWGSAATNSYRLQVATDPACSTRVVDVMGADPAHQVEEGNALSNGSHYWRSAALIDGNWQWSSVHSFELHGGWQQLAGVPLTVGAGAAVAYDEDILGHEAILTLVGGNSTGFYGYDISGNEWDTLETAPVSVGLGSSLTTHDATEAGGLYPWAAFGGSDTADAPYYFNPAQSPHWVAFSLLSQDSLHNSRFPTQLGAGASVVYGTNKNLYLITGLDNGCNPTDNFYRLQPPGSLMDGSQASTSRVDVARAHVISHHDNIEVEYQLPVSAHVRATLRDAVGRQVSVHNLGEQTPGTHRLGWTRDSEGRRLSAGTYFVLLDLGDEHARLKAVVR